MEGYILFTRRMREKLFSVFLYNINYIIFKTLIHILGIAFLIFGFWQYFEFRVLNIMVFGNAAFLHHLFFLLVPINFNQID